MPTRARPSPARAVVAALMVLPLTACAPLDDAPADPPSADGAKTVEAVEAVENADAAEPIVELGEFDPEHDEFVVFDPCTEIPRDVLDEAGLGEMVSEPTYSPLKSVTCSFRAEPQGLRLELLTMAGDAVPKQRVQDLGFMISEIDSNIGGLYVHHMGEGTEDACTAAVHTTEGRWTMTYTSGSPVPETDVLCTRAIDYLEAIHFQLGERNGSTT